MGILILFAGTEQPIFGSSGGISGYTVRNATCGKFTNEATNAAIALGGNKTCGHIWSRLSSEVAGHQQHVNSTHTHAKKSIYPSATILHIFDQSERRLPFFESLHSGKW